MAKKTKCERCKGKGYRVLIVGPHINELGAVPGGPAKYDCQQCNGTGKKLSTSRK